MTDSHQFSRSDASKNTTNRVIAKSVKCPQSWAIDVESTRSSCAGSRATKTSSSATKPMAVGLGPVKTVGKPVSRRKTTHALTMPQVRLIMKGALHAIVIGLPLNRFITIDWELAGIDDALKAQAAFLKLLRDWLGRSGQATAYVWVQERGKAIGIHSHILICISPSLVCRLGLLQRGWLKRVGVVLKKGVIRSHPIGLTSSVAFAPDAFTQALYRQNLEEIVGYIIKGADTKARRSHGLRRTPQYSLITGKRAGTSRNVGAKAIGAYGASD
jgi:hypothetical protein